MKGMYLNGGKTLKGKRWLTKCLKKVFGKGKKRVPFSEPLVKVLRMVDGEKPTMGFVYKAMDQAKEAIKSAYGDKDKNIFFYGESLMKDGTNNYIDLYMLAIT
jgi:hypothetical protein